MHPELTYKAVYKSILQAYYSALKVSAYFYSFFINYITLLL